MHNFSPTKHHTHTHSTLLMLRKTEKIHCRTRKATALVSMCAWDSRSIEEEFAWMCPAIMQKLTNRVAFFARSPCMCFILNFCILSIFPSATLIQSLFSITKLSTPWLSETLLKHSALVHKFPGNYRIYVCSNRIRILLLWEKHRLMMSHTVYNGRHHSGGEHLLDKASVSYKRKNR